MAHRGRESANERFALAIAAGLTVRAAAKRAGIGERTAHRRAADPEFVRRVAELRAAMTRRALGILSGSVSAAARQLRRLLTGPPAVALRAAVAIIDTQAKLRDAVEVNERLSELERMVRELLNERRTPHRPIGRNGSAAGHPSPN